MPGPGFVAVAIPDRGAVFGVRTSIGVAFQYDRRLRHEDVASEMPPQVTLGRYLRSESLHIGADIVSSRRIRRPDVGKQSALSWRDAVLHQRSRAAVWNRDRRRLNHASNVTERAQRRSCWRPLKPRRPTTRRRHSATPASGSATPSGPRRQWHFVERATRPTLRRYACRRRAADQGFDEGRSGRGRATGGSHTGACPAQTHGMATPARTTPPRSIRPRATAPKCTVAREGRQARTGAPWPSRWRRRLAYGKAQSRRATSRRLMPQAREAEVFSASGLVFALNDDAIQAPVEGDRIVFFVDEQCFLPNMQESDTVVFRQGLPHLRLLHERGPLTLRAQAHADRRPDGVLRSPSGSR